jgi:hypothetical protein
VTPEINALSTVLLVGSIGLVALSQTAQSGVALYTRSMALGVAAGAVAFLLYSLAGQIGSGTYSATSLLRAALLLGAVLWARTPARNWYTEFIPANPSGKILACLILLVVIVATVVSLQLLLG